MLRIVAFVLGAGLTIPALAGETLGFFEQRFSAINFQKNKWTRAEELPCLTYTAAENGSTVEVMRFGTNNMVQFKATRGLKVAVCGSTAAFEEGFEAEIPPK